jgi:integrase
LADVDWERNRMTVMSPKTSRHAGHESRVVPIFPELRLHLEAVFDQAEPGTEWVITRHRKNSNLRTQLKRIIRRAGLTPWPRITHNLRASRATELAADYPAHVAAAWLGHSTLVAQKHYWTVTDADFERAVQIPGEDGAESGAPSARNQSQ